MADARKLDKLVFDGYLEGLADAGWQGDPRLIRLGYAAGSVLCFGLGYLVFEPPEAMIPWLEQAFGLPIDKFSVLVADLRNFWLELADEARSLLASLS